MLLIALALVFLVVALTRPRSRRLFRGRYRRTMTVTSRPTAPIDPTAGLRDPARPL